MAASASNNSHHKPSAEVMKRHRYIFSNQIHCNMIDVLSGYEKELIGRHKARPCQNFVKTDEVFKMTEPIPELMDIVPIVGPVIRAVLRLGGQITYKHLEERSIKEHLRKATNIFKFIHHWKDDLKIIIEQTTMQIFHIYQHKFALLRNSYHKQDVEVMLSRLASIAFMRIFNYIHRNIDDGKLKFVENQNDLKNVFVDGILYGSEDDDNPYYNRYASNDFNDFYDNVGLVVIDSHNHHKFYIKKDHKIQAKLFGFRLLTPREKHMSSESYIELDKQYDEKKYPALKQLQSFPFTNVHDDIGFSDPNPPDSINKMVSNGNQPMRFHQQINTDTIFQEMIKLYHFNEQQGEQVNSIDQIPHQALQELKQNILKILTQIDITDFIYKLNNNVDELSVTNNHRRDDDHSITLNTPNDPNDPSQYFPLIAFEISTDWRHLIVMLDYNFDTKSLEIDGRDEQHRACLALKKWHERSGGAATLDKLIKALKAINRNDIVLFLENKIKERKINLKENPNSNTKKETEIN